MRALTEKGVAYLRSQAEGHHLFGRLAVEAQDVLALCHLALRGLEATRATAAVTVGDIPKLLDDLAALREWIDEMRDDGHPDNYRKRTPWLETVDAAIAALMEELPPIRFSDGYPLARAFHEAYERLAPQYGYETRPETRTFDPFSPNGKLMTAVCAEMLSLIRRADAIRQCAKVCEEEGAGCGSDKHYACHDCADAIRARTGGKP